MHSDFTRSDTSYFVGLHVQSVGFLMLSYFGSLLPVHNKPSFSLIIVKKLSSLKRLLRTTSATRRSKTANITKR